MKDLVNTTEMYLRTLYDLREDGVPARQTRLVGRLHQTSGTVCQTVGRLKQSGLVSITTDRTVELTERGLARAVQVTRKHRLAERLLTEVVEMPATLAHVEACRLQHVMSEAVERRIVDILDGPVTSPWGNPIPGLAEFGVTTEAPTAAVRLADLAACGSPATGTVRCISEQAQSDPKLIAMLIDAGVIPGARVTVTRRARVYALRGLCTVELPANLAHVVGFESG
ncbi:metal-dependent transcriptional regulator [Rhodococcus sp. NPDC003318]|uniref:metal-dependent transcriptional regulator n=1 Tax=Rhodococcus sp. NPDC003318 TaxID=3364503 RepID=UPI0036A52DDE